MIDLEMHKRRIACVIDYFDEAHDLPWDYVLRTTDGRFEAIVTRLLGDEGRELSLGIFDDCNAAVAMIHEHLDRVRAADESTWRKNGYLDFNRPTMH